MWSAPTCILRGLWHAAFGAAIYCWDCSMQSLHLHYHVRTFVPRSLYVNPLQTATSASCPSLTHPCCLLIQSEVSRITSRAALLCHGVRTSHQSSCHRRSSAAFSPPSSTTAFAASMRRSSEVSFIQRSSYARPIFSLYSRWQSSTSVLVFHPH